ncbi:MAG: hypothetical protein FWG38_01795 [Defluviitaleaceae bacterium]|nr:hypothetical protein [Defluviitaleaceae bacterium]
MNFNGSISREVLNHYLSRAVTHASLLDTHEGQTDTFEDDLRMLLHEGAKFIGRAAYVWADLDDAEHWRKVRERAALCHAADPEMMLQCCVFECVYKSFCERTPVPAYVFEAFGQTPEERCFSFAAMGFEDGRYDNHWGKDTTVPNILSLEGKMWIYYRACEYIKCGIEAIHFGQVWLIGALDTGWTAWQGMLKMVREYAKKHARRGYVVCDAHCHGLITADGHSIFDFNAFPLRLREVLDDPQKCVLELGYLDSIYGKSQGGIHPSGWEADPLPFLVELDNFGVSKTPGEATPDGFFAWGYDEITWFAAQPAEYRAQFLWYANNWINTQFAEGWLQMPSRRMITWSYGDRGIYRANNKSAACPLGMGDEDVIAEIWRR